MYLRIKPWLFWVSIRQMSGGYPEFVLLPRIWAHFETLPFDSCTHIPFQSPKTDASGFSCWKRLRNKTRTSSTKRKSFFNFCLALASTISCHEQQEDTGAAESSGSFMTHDAAALLRHSCKNMEKPISVVKSGSFLLETWHFKQPPSVGAVLVLCLYNDFLISNFRFVERLITGRLDIRSGDSHVIRGDFAG